MNSFDKFIKLIPESSPNFDVLKDEPKFDASRHLSLEKPKNLYDLKSFGYTSEDLQNTPSDVAITSCFRVLSQEGVEALNHVCEQLEKHKVKNRTRGGGYRSTFLRDLCFSEDINNHVAEIMGVELIPNPMLHQTGHINYSSSELKNKNSWHFDTVPFNIVMFLTDLNKISGGEFQYFKGTKTNFEYMQKMEKSIPVDDVVTPFIANAGYAVAMQGNYVVHQSNKLNLYAKRISIVNSFIPRSPVAKDIAPYEDLILNDASSIITAEYFRQRGIRWCEYLSERINYPNYYADNEAYVSDLQHLIKEIEDTVSKLRR